MKKKKILIIVIFIIIIIAFVAIIALMFILNSHKNKQEDEIRKSKFNILIKGQLNTDTINYDDILYVGKDVLISKKDIETSIKMTKSASMYTKKSYEKIVNNCKVTYALYALAINKGYGVKEEEVESCYNEFEKDGKATKKELSKNLKYGEYEEILRNNCKMMLITDKYRNALKNKYYFDSSEKETVTWEKKYEKIESDAVNEQHFTTNKNYSNLKKFIVN